MSIAKPNITSVDKTTAASPLSEDIIKMLQGQIAEGAFGTGSTPLQRQAGTSIEQFLNSGAGRFDPSADLGALTGIMETLQTRGAPNVRDVGPLALDPQFDMKKMIDDLAKVHGRRADEAVADQREQFGVAGARFGTPLATGEARLRAGLDEGFNVQIGDLIRMMDESNRAVAGLNLQRDQLGINRDIAAGGAEMNLAQILAQLTGQRAGLGLQANQMNVGNLLQGAQLAQGFGQQNMDPFMMLAQMGILPPEIVATPNPWMQLLTSVLSGASNVAASAAGAA